MRTRRLALCVATAVLAVASNSAGAAVTTPTKNEPSHGGFRTPSGNIFCNFETAVGDNGGPSRFLYCAIKSGIKPAAPRKAPGCSRALWTEVKATGRATWGGSTCPGQDEGQGPVRELATKVLPYGKSWSWRGMSCTSAFEGLTCRNLSRHGFFMSRMRTRLF